MFKKDPIHEGGGNSEQSTTVVGSGASFNGVLKVNGSLRVDGEVEGTVEIARHLTVGASGVMKADIRAHSALVAGRIKGTIQARDKVELEKGSRLEGDVHANSFKIMDGAFFQGQCTMGEPQSSGSTAGVSTAGGSASGSSIAGGSTSGGSNSAGHRPGGRRPGAGGDDLKVVGR